MTLGVLAFFAGALVVAVAVHLAETYRRQRELVLRPRTPDPGPLVLELVPVYGNGATGALARIEVGAIDAEVGVPPGAVAFQLHLTHRAGLYAGATTTVEHESEPPPAFLRSER